MLCLALRKGKAAYFPVPPTPYYYLGRLYKTYYPERQVGLCYLNTVRRNIREVTDKKLKVAEFSALVFFCNMLWSNSTGSLIPSA